MEKTQSGQGAQQISALSPACAAVACTSPSLPIATRRQKRVNPASRCTHFDRPLLGNRVNPPHVLQQESTTYLTKGPKPKCFILISTFLRPQMIFEVVNTDAQDDIQGYQIPFKAVVLKTSYKAGAPHISGVVNLITVARICEELQVASESRLGEARKSGTRLLTLGTLPFPRVLMLT